MIISEELHDLAARYEFRIKKLLISVDPKFNDDEVHDSAVTELWRVHSAERGPEHTIQSWLRLITPALSVRVIFDPF